METKNERVTIDEVKVKEIIDDLDNKYLEDCKDNEYPDPEFLTKCCNSKFEVCHSFHFVMENFLIMNIKYPLLFSEESYKRLTKYFIEKHFKEEFDKKPLITQIDIYNLVDCYLRYDENLPKNFEDLTDEWLKQKFEFYMKYVMVEGCDIDYDTTVLKFLLTEAENVDRQNVTIKDYIWESLEELKFELFGICLE